MRALDLPLAHRLMRRYGSPLYVYDGDLIAQRYAELRKAMRHEPSRIFYACKANENVAILRLLRELGAGIEIVSPGMLALAREAGFATEDIIFTGTSLRDDELRYLLDERVWINADSVGQLARIGKMAPGSCVGVRINAGVGDGHHAHVITGGHASRFGIPLAQLREAIDVAREHGLRIECAHQHIGSNVRSAQRLLEGVQALLEAAQLLEHVRVVDVGGGMGVPYRPHEEPLDLAAWGEGLTASLAGFCAQQGRAIALWAEPGRYLVAEAGTLLCTVTEVKEVDGVTHVSVDTGFHHLARPLLYDAYHEIENLSNPSGAPRSVTVAGNLCETSDVLAHGREIPACRPGDTLAIRTAGAYGYAMASHYNARSRPAEILLRGADVACIREREGRW